jgi:hypothetical protein
VVIVTVIWYTLTSELLEESIVRTPLDRVMKLGITPVDVSTMAEIVVVVAQVPRQALICGVAWREAAFAVPWEMLSVSAGFNLTVVVRV